MVADSVFAEHLAHCPSCQQALARASQLVALLRTLPRKQVPPMMEGAAVASMHAGSRQDRAVASLRSLGRMVPPPELSRAVRSNVGEGISPVPPVLERMLAEELADAGRATARRAGARLQRVRAPAELEARLAQSFGAAASKTTRAIPWRSSLAALCLIGLAIWTRLSSSESELPKQARGRSIAAIEFRYAQTPETLDATSQSLIDVFTGGTFVSLCYRHESR